ncbi:MAG TPA: MFS transporter [Terriglobia bacterium]|nr:MFS transporter [Terriglobia bacterium]
MEPRVRPDHGHAVFASFLGWTLDAFDFFVVVFLVDTLAAQFAVSKAAIVGTLTLTLAMRPLGALLFGLLADRYGRRGPFMAAVLYYSVIELACGFAPSYGVFLVLRGLYGIGMGGVWGVSASLAMEAAPERRRGMMSGILQSGYPIGYLLAAVAARFILPAWGWRAMFWAGATPALLVAYIYSKVPESEAWRRHKESSFGGILRTVAAEWKSALYLVALMALMNCLSHGTQDLYPDFLKTAHHVAASTVTLVAMLYNVGAVLGGIAFGQLSNSFGRRRSMILAIVLALAVVPLWAYGSTLTALALGAFVMQVGVQGAWGIIPAHLNELAPDAARGLLPGFAYQLGILIASPTNTIEYALRDHFGYARAMTMFIVAVIVVDGIIIALGREQRGKDFMKAATSDE